MIDPEIKEEMKETSSRTGISMSDIVRRGIWNQLQELQTGGVNE